MAQSIEGNGGGLHRKDLSAARQTTPRLSAFGRARPCETVRDRARPCETVRGRVRPCGTVQGFAERERHPWHRALHRATAGLLECSIRSLCGSSHRAKPVEARRRIAICVFRAHTTDGF